MSEQEQVHPEVAMLCNDTIAAIQQLCEYHHLFNEKNLGLMNDTSPEFFQRLRQHFQTAFVLNISRLTDHAQTGYGNRAKANLTVKTLEYHAQGQLFESRVQHLCKTSVAESESIRNARNKLVAHRDLAEALSEQGLTIPDFLARTERVLEHIYEALQLFYAPPIKALAPFSTWMYPSYQTQVDEVLELPRQAEC
ncbi:MAG: hypothetical protein IPM46_10990 [Flavobacteriales bacterium]|nr:hypothetical protein [Flavobacteriales bacterium]